MLIIIDKKIPDEAKKNLAAFGELMELATRGITYETISGHPDIFFCQVGEIIVVAPNLPADYLDQLDRKHIPYTLGKLDVRPRYPATAQYNAVFSYGTLIHNLDLTDPVICDQVDKSSRINVNQGYCRCNLLALKGNSYITSDQGIREVLNKRGFNVLYVDSNGILLPGYPHGFIGGACGTFQDKVFFIGNLAYHKQGNEIHYFLRNLDYHAVDLYDGPLFDGGSIFFIEYPTYEHTKAK